MSDDNNFDAAKVRLPDGRMGYDCTKLAQIKTEGISLKDYREHVILVRTRNTLYTLVTCGKRVTGHATRHDGSLPSYLPEPTEIHVNGSTWGGSMLKLDYIGVGMHLEFSYAGEPRITTTTIENVRVAPLVEATAKTGA